MNLPILGLGTAVPDPVMSQVEAAELAYTVLDADDQQRRVLKVLYRKSGVENRHTCLPHRIALSWLPDRETRPDGEVLVSAGPALGPTTRERMQFYEAHAFPLAQRAARRALEGAATRPDEITHLVTVSCTGFAAPGVDVQLMQELGLPATTERVHVGFMGCHGALNGLRVSQGLAAARPDARILLCAVELCSLHYRFQWDPERFLGNALFADGAAAMILGRADAPERPLAAELRATGSCLIPDSTGAMTWQIGDHGFEMALAATVPDLIRDHLRPWLQDWLREQGTRIEEISCWAVHPGGPRILSAVEQCLDLPSDALAVSRSVLRTKGNMSSPTVLFILEQFRERAESGPCVMLGFGPGLMAETALLV